MSDTIASVKLTAAQAARNKRIQCPDFKCPDVVIFARRRGFAGLAIELKAESPFRRDGTLRKNEHLEGQARTHEQLRAEGWEVAFVWTFEHFRDIVNHYLRQ